MRSITVLALAGLLAAAPVGLVRAQSQSGNDGLTPHGDSMTGSSMGSSMGGSSMGAPMSGGGATYPETHIEAPGQGAQDPARSEFLEGWSRDMPRCMNTLLARKENPDEAHEVCTKILTDLGD